MTTTSGADRPAARAGDRHPNSAELSEAADDTIREVGARIRGLRAARGLTLQELAERTGVSVSMLSMVERGQATPSIGTLVAVSSILSVQMADLFSAGQERRSPVRKLADQLDVEAPTGVLRRLAFDDHTLGVEMVINEYEPGTSSGPQPTRHAGHEFGILLSGRLSVDLGGEEFALSPGDSIAYDSTTPHRITNVGRTRARAVWVNLRS